jgi:hypothetical protein
LDKTKEDNRDRERKICGKVESKRMK